MKSLIKFLFPILGIGVLIVFYATSDLPFIYNIRNKPFFVSTNGEPPHQYYTFRSIKGIGVCDSAHNMIIPANYKNIIKDTILNNYIASRNGYITIFDASGQKILRGKKIITFTVNDIDFFYKTYDEWDDCGISDQFGNEIVPNLYTSIETIGNTNNFWFQAYDDSSYVCIYDKAGNVVIPNNKHFIDISLQISREELDDQEAIYLFGDGMSLTKASEPSSIYTRIPYWFLVKADNNLGAYDISGNEIISPANYTSIERPDLDHFLLRNGNYVGICKADGNIIIQPDRFDKIRIFGMPPYYWYQVYQSNKESHTHDYYCEHSGLCDQNGRLVIKPKYNDIKYDEYDDEFYTREHEFSSSWEPTGIHLTNHPKPRPQSTQTSSSSSTRSKKTASNNSGNIEYSYPCALCNGTGTQWNLLFGPTLCSFCGGTGVIKNTVHVDFSQAPNNYSSTPTPTPNYSSPSSSSSSSSSTGSNHATRVTKTETCSHCWGSGTCEQCLGKGWYYSPFTSNMIECSTCDHNYNGKCRWCHGTGTVTKSSWEY